MTYFVSLHLREVNSLPFQRKKKHGCPVYTKMQSKTKLKGMFFPDLPEQVFQHTLTRDTMDIMSACKKHLMGQKVPRQDI